MARAVVYIDDVTKEVSAVPGHWFVKLHILGSIGRQHAAFKHEMF